MSCSWTRRLLPEISIDICQCLDERDVLARDARIYIEQDRSATEPDLPTGWRVLKDKTAGNGPLYAGAARGLTGRSR